MRKRERFEQVLRHAFSIDEFVLFTKELLVNETIIAPNKYNKEFSNFSFI